MLVVQKFGGATVSNPQKIRAIAARISNEYRKGHQIVAVVSAMGSSTNELIRLAHEVSPRPSLREMDMLLSTGERVAMSLLTMALHDLSVPAISFTGSQAGILTDDSHVSAFIHDVKPFRIEEALKANKVVVLAGFQGVSPVTKEITTLGRGGTDTTAIAIATALKADHCEILKDVPAVFSADPRLCPLARPLHHLSYQQLAEMTFWGAKVLHYRSVELASRSKVPIYVGPAHDLSEGTWIRSQGDVMYEKPQILSLNSHEQVLLIESTKLSTLDAIEQLERELSQNQISSPQYLGIESVDGKTQIYLTAPAETLTALAAHFQKSQSWILANDSLCSITATCSGATSTSLATQMMEQLKKESIAAHSCRWSALSLTYFINARDRNRAIASLHNLTSC